MIKAWQRVIPLIPRTSSLPPCLRRKQINNSNHIINGEKEATLSSPGYTSDVGSVTFKHINHKTTIQTFLAEIEAFQELYGTSYEELPPASLLSNDDDEDMESNLATNQGGNVSQNFSKIKRIPPATTQTHQRIPIGTDTSLQRQTILHHHKVRKRRS